MPPGRRPIKQPSKHPVVHKDPDDHPHGYGNPGVANPPSTGGGSLAKSAMAVAAAVGAIANAARDANAQLAAVAAASKAASTRRPIGVKQKIREYNREGIDEESLGKAVQSGVNAALRQGGGNIQTEMRRLGLA